MEFSFLETVLFNFGIDSLDTELPTDVTNDLFEHIYIWGDGEVREIAKACFLNKDHTKIDPNYGENLAAIEAARIGDTQLLEAFIAIGMRNKVKKEVIRVAANYNQPECIDILIQKGKVDARLLFQSSAYQDYPDIKKVVDQRIAGI